MANSFDYAVNFYKVYPNRFSEGTLPGPAKAWADPHLVRYNKDTDDFEPIVRKVLSCSDWKKIGVAANTDTFLIFDEEDTESVKYVLYYSYGTDCYEFTVYDRKGHRILEESESYVVKFWDFEKSPKKEITFKNPESKVFRKTDMGDYFMIQYRDGNSKQFWFYDENN